MAHSHLNHRAARQDIPQLLIGLFVTRNIAFSMGDIIDQDGNVERREQLGNWIKKSGFQRATKVNDVDTNLLGRILAAELGRQDMTPVRSDQHQVKAAFRKRECILFSLSTRRARHDNIGIMSVPRQQTFFLNDKMLPNPSKQERKQNHDLHDDQDQNQCDDGPADP